MNKKIKDSITFVIFGVAIGFALSLESFVLSIILLIIIAYAFDWSLDRNVEYGYLAAKEEEDGV